MDSKRVIIVDYGLGNLHSVNKAVAKAGGEAGDIRIPGGDPRS